jgi:hypothetical protein
MAQARSRATVSLVTSGRIVAAISPDGCRATAVRELFVWVDPDGDHGLLPVADGGEPRGGQPDFRF